MLRLKKKQAGFTLLELLVVVAILAAIAGTTTIALRDTDARASAAAHVAMMDELNKGVRTFRVLRKNVLPNNFDSLIEVDDAALANPQLLSIAAHEDLTLITTNDALEAQMADGGLTHLQYAANDQDPDDAGTCANIENLVADTHNAVVAGNIFMGAPANGCGLAIEMNATDAADDSRPIMIWSGGYERVMGDEGRGFDLGYTATTAVNDGTTNGAVTAAVVGTPILLAVGAGPSSNLFNQDKLGGLTTVPVYRHVSGTEYNRFVLLFYIGEFGAGASLTAGVENMHLVAVVDGAGDTKEEELGEWDGTRNTI